MAKARAIAAKNTVQCVLGAADMLAPIFSYYSMPKSWDQEKCLREGMEHAFSFTMLRDQFYGGWAHVWKEPTDGLYHLKLTSPTVTDDVTGYADLIPRFVNAVSLAQKAIASVPQTDEMKQGNLRFLPPFGLSMLNARGVLLLHYPPDETITYLDYLHSHTTKRWEALLIANGHPGADNPLLESIVDVCPVAADGGTEGGNLVDELCSHVSSDLTTYVADLLLMLLRSKQAGKASVTQPMVALGAPAQNWLMDNFKAQVRDQAGRAKSLKPHTVLKLKLHPDQDLVTPVITMPHPCVYYRHPGDRTEMLRQDLIGTRWYVKMAANPKADPQKVLEDSTKYWNAASNQARFRKVAQAHSAEFDNLMETDKP